MTICSQRVLLTGSSCWRAASCCTLRQRHRDCKSPAWLWAEEGCLRSRGSF